MLRGGGGQNAVCGNGAWLHVGSALHARRKGIGTLRGGRGELLARSHGWKGDLPARGELPQRIAVADCALPA
jgi:hypothetical protein